MSDIQPSTVLEKKSSSICGAAGTGALETRLGSRRRPDAALSPQGGGLKGGEGSLPTSGGTGSDSGRPSQSPVLSEGGGEEPAVQGVEHTEVGEEDLPKKRGKRKLPLPDLDAIKDAGERRRQRRLIKNRNTAAASRVRKQRELEELAQRMRHLEQDNASLRSHVGSRDAEIARLRATADGLQSCHGTIPQALPPSDSFPPVGPGHPAQEPAGELAHQLPAQQQQLHAGHQVASLGQSPNASYRQGSPTGIWGDPGDPPRQHSGQQHNASPQPVHLEPALSEDQFARAFGEARRPNRAALDVQGRAAPAAGSATSSLSAVEQAALTPAPDWHQPAPSIGRLRMAPHRRGGSVGDAEAQLPPMGTDVPGSAGTHVDFLAFPWPEVMEMVGQQEQRLSHPAKDWPRQA